jgi:pyruvate ferredoxin oxidoreductase alpha subunit
MGARDSGWIQIYCENAQEVYESIILAVRIAEHPDIQLPVMVCQDGFITSHAIEGVQLFEDKVVKDFVGEYKPRFSLLDVDNPSTVGPLDLQDFYFEHKRQQSEAMQKAIKVIPELFDDFEKTFGKRHSFVDEYKLDGAEVAICVLSSTAGTVKGTVDKLRDKGLKVGLLRPHFFRPFPRESIVKSLTHLKAIAVLDRSEAFSGQGGPLFSEIKAALYEEKSHPLVANYIYGLGGRDVFKEDIEGIYTELLEIARTGKIKRLVQFIGVRE